METGTALVARWRGGVAPRAFLRWFPALAVAAIAVAYQCYEGTTSDVSWLITASERLLDGGTAYVDFFELNPPASILLYLPTVALAHALRVAPEIAVKASVLLVFAANLALCRVIEGRCGGALAAALAAVCLLLPGDVFAQREHFIVLFLLPFLALTAMRSQGSTATLAVSVLAGFEAGLAVAVKPFFVLAVALPVGFALWRRRAHGREMLRIAFAPEVVALAIMLVAYVAVVLLIFPAFLTHGLPIALDVYSLYTNPHLAFLYSWHAILWAAAATLTLLLTPRSGDDGSIFVALLASTGCLVAMMLQAKYFDYHAYPSIALAMVALAMVLHRRLVDPSPRPDAGIRAAVASVAALGLFVRALAGFAAPLPDSALRRVLAELGPHPRVMALSMGPGLAHPLARDLGGTFVGRLASPWMYFLIVRALRDPALPVARRHLLQQYVDLEKRVTAEDIIRERPDFILVSHSFDTDRKLETWPFSQENWIKSTPALLAAFADYAPVRSVGDVAVWLRKRPVR